MRVCVLSLKKDGFDSREIYSYLKHNHSRHIDFLDSYCDDSLLHLQPYDVYFVVLDKCDEKEIKIIEDLRSNGDRSYLVFFLKNMVNLASLIKPTIRPSAILSLPVDYKKIAQVIDDIRVDQDKRYQIAEKLSVKIDGELYQIPLSVILYIEATNKKIVIRTLGQEIAFYSTLNKISEKLNNTFIRCHKGFIVNELAIKQVIPKESCIILTNGQRIPFSRSYKDEIKQWIDRSVR